jgi:hypothetical protein
MQAGSLEGLFAGNSNDDERKYLSYNIAISLRGRKEFFLKLIV